jgi:hypothetical protein
MDRATIHAVIRKAKPDITESSVRTYTSNVLRAHRAFNSTEFNKNSDKLTELFKHKSTSVQKSIAVACLIYARAKNKPHKKLAVLLKVLDGKVREEVVS